MEFSFDRNRRSETSNTQESYENANSQQASNHDEVDTSSITNERLRKAIERNRERQRLREAQEVRAQHMGAQSGLFDNQNRPTQPEVENLDNEVKKEEVNVKNQEEVPMSSSAEIPLEEPVEIPPRTMARTGVRQRLHRPEMTEETPPQEIGTRRAPARAHDTEFAPIKRSVKKSPPQISYTTGSRNKNKPIDPLLVNYFVKAVWLFCGFLILRLIFAQGGVTDFFSQRALLKNRFLELERIRLENMQLVSEIEKMQTDSGYQKKLVRDNLGFIARDEYLILFPKEKAD